MSKDVTLHTVTPEIYEDKSNRKSLLSRTIQVGFSTLMSRFLGLAREFLMSRFLGVGEMADAFFTAFKIPNSLRKVFAEGALSAAFIPTFVAIIKKGLKREADALMTLSFLFFEGILLFLCGLIYWKAALIIWFIAPGWYQNDIVLVQASYAISYLKLLISFIIFLSSSALLAGALQSVNHFFVSAFGPVLLNIIFIFGLILCSLKGLPVETLCLFILLGGFAQFILHLFMYFKLKFTFSAPTQDTWIYFRHVMVKFLPCLLSMSILEVNLFLSTSLATYLPKGSISLLNYANRFMGIPLGVLIGAFSTILLPYFSRISTYAPQRLPIYLFEAAKVVFWVTVPCSLVMGFLSEKIFHTIFLSDKFTLEHVHIAGNLLVTFLAGLFFFSLYKVLLNIYYSLHDTQTPFFISVFIVAVNFVLCKLLAPWLGVSGLALAFVITSCIHVFLFALMLYKKYNFTLYFRAFGAFTAAALLQITVLFLAFLTAYYLMYYGISQLHSQKLVQFFLYKVGFWLWVGPLCSCMILSLIRTRKFFNIRLFSWINL